MNIYKCKQPLRKASGQGMIETLITFPVLLFIGAALFQLYIIWEAKLTLNQASLMSARAGATTSIDIQQMQSALAKGLIPLQGPDLDDPITPANTIYADALSQALDNVVNNSVMRIANPTLETFNDFDTGSGIPSDHLQARSTQIGTNSGINIQDANLLRIQIAYGLQLNVPFVGPFIMGIVKIINDQNEWHKQNTLDNNLFPLISVATVRMQSPPMITPANQPFFMSRQDVIDDVELQVID